MVLSNATGQHPNTEESHKQIGVFQSESPQPTDKSEKEKVSLLFAVNISSDQTTEPALNNMTLVEVFLSAIINTVGRYHLIIHTPELNLKPKVLFTVIDDV